LGFKLKVTSTDDGLGGDPTECKRSGEEKVRQDPSRCGIIVSSPVGSMIFLNNHVIGISWLTLVGVSHKILPTLYILRGKQVSGAFKIRWA